MIENLFRTWLLLEMEDQYRLRLLAKALNDDDFAMDIWEDFEKRHHQDFIELVREQMKAVLIKKGKKHENRT